MKLPNGKRAELGTKLDDYVLNPLHPHGKHKARLFETALGITLLNAEVLRQGLLEQGTSWHSEGDGQPLVYGTHCQ
jgi:hypothetical protein